MNGIFSNLVNALVEIWKNIGIPQKVSIVLVAILTIGATAGIVYFGSRPDWQPLYTNLDPKTASKVYDSVKESGVQVKLTDGGKTIMVPSADVYKLRLKVVGDGISVERNATQGLELFDNMKLGLTDKQQQVAFQRAIQGELERMIGQMPGILGAKVILTIPQKAVFKKDKTHPTASVMLVLDQARSAGKEQIDSIRHMVASAVTGMTAQDVTITDNKGNLLCRQVSETESAEGDTNRELELTEKMEKQLKEKAEAILRPVVGFDKVVAMVSCDIDFDSVERIVKNYDSEKAVANYTKSVIETQSRSNGSGAGGKVGVASNTPTEVSVKSPNAGGGAEEKLSSESKSTKEDKFSIPETLEKRVVKGGKIKRLTVAVTVSKKADGTSWGSDKLKEFKSLVSAAVGVDNYFSSEELRKNDPVVVRENDFIKPVEQKFDIPVTDTISMNVEKISHSPLVRPILGALLLGFLFILFKRYVNRGAVEGAEMNSVIGMGGSAAAAASIAGGNSAIYSEEIKRLESDDDKQSAELGTLMDNIQAKTSGSPQAVANIMEKWLAADQG